MREKKKTKRGTKSGKTRRVPLTRHAATVARLLAHSLHGAAKLDADWVGHRPHDGTLRASGQGQHLRGCDQQAIQLTGFRAGAGRRGQLAGLRLNYFLQEGI